MDMEQKKEFLTKRQERYDRIIANYRECTGLLNQVFEILYDEVCGPCVEGKGEGYKGVGCCIGTHSDDGLGGPAESDIYRMRQDMAIKAREEGREIGEVACGYFETGRGCILGDLKAPGCLTFYCISEEVEKKYGIDLDSRKMGDVLEAILCDTELDKKGKAVLGSKSVDPKVLQDFKDYLQGMIDAIKRVKGSE